MVLSLLRTAGARVASFFGSRAGASAAAGAGAGMLVDDVPLLSNLDPTENGGNPVSDILMMAVLAIAAFIALDIVAGDN